jgi:hypothetical protein
MDTASGRLSFQYDARRGQTMAFVHRQVLPRQPVQLSANRISPMIELAKESMYQAARARISGEETPAAPGRWPSAVINSEASRD